MSIFVTLASLALKGTAQAAGTMAGTAVVGSTVDSLGHFLLRRFTDHSAKLTRALERSSNRAWRAVEIALAGRSWWDLASVALASGDERAIRAQVQAYLEAHPLDGVNGFGPDFRAQCLAQLQAARKAGLLDKGPIDPTELAQRVGDLSKFGDQSATVRAEGQALDDVEARLRATGYEALATFLTLRPNNGPPLLVSALRYFFQREVERDEELFRGLAYAKLDSLSEGQNSGFTQLGQVLEEHGARLEGLLADVRGIVAQTHSEVLDIKTELSRQSEHLRELGSSVLRALEQHNLSRRELRPGDSLSVRDEDERRLVRDLVKRYRELPESERRRLPALLNAVGKLEVMSGDFESAQRDFRTLAEVLPEDGLRAEAAHNAFLAALERRAWDEALGLFKEAVALAPGRFAPFPLEKFQPEGILGAGGFGIAFLCRNRHTSGRVVIKTLRREHLERDLKDVFREAQALEDLEHPAIIRIRDCDFAGSEKNLPYIVMDYFQGTSLTEHVQKQGPLTLGELLPLARLTAEGLSKAHARGILHRDVKPGNLLVRRNDNGKLDGKLIDFGLALRLAQGKSTERSSMDRTLAGSSIAGTLDYAAPEQLGKLPGVAVGPASDVYGLGKLCCFALFGTPAPTFQHWQKLPRPIAELLGRCIDDNPSNRPASCAEVATTLERILAPQPTARPAAKPVEARPVREAQPVEELPEAKPVRSERREPEERRRDRYRDDRRDDRRDRDRRPLPPPPRRGWGWLMVPMVFLILVGGCVGGMWVMLQNRGQFGPSMNWPGGPGFGGKAKEPAAQPIPAAEFPEALAELEKKTTAPSRLSELAARLAQTPPTKEQREAHLELVQAGIDFCNDDDVYRVSVALNPIAESKDLMTQINAVEAMQHWGTKKNVGVLIARLQTRSHEAGRLRIGAIRALGHLKAPEGVEPAAARIDDVWDSRDGAVEALQSWGRMPEMEDAMLTRLKAARHFSSQERLCQVLGKVGSAKSLEELRKQNGAFVKEHADAAIALIEQYERDRAKPMKKE